MKGKVLPVLAVFVTVVVFVGGFYVMKLNVQQKRDGARRALSSNNIRVLLFACVEFESRAGGEWPESLDQLKTMFDPDQFDELMVNPVTGDNPGYEYVFPGKRRSFVHSKTIVFYQLRNGERDESLPVGTGDGRVIEKDLMDAPLVP